MAGTTDEIVARGLNELLHEPAVELAVRLGGIATTFKMRGRTLGDPRRLEGWTLRVPADESTVEIALPLRLERFNTIDVVDGAIVATTGENRLELRRIGAAT